MASKRTSSQKSSKRTGTASSRRRAASGASEPAAARALQAIILAVGVMLLLSALFGWRTGLALVGLVVLVSAFPPLRRHVDRWLVGKARGDEANQAAVIRMVVGITILLSVLITLFR